MAAWMVNCGSIPILIRRRTILMTELSQISASRPLIVVGAGKMASALMAGWLRNGATPEGIIAVRPSEDGRTALAAAFPGITIVPGGKALPEGLTPRALLLAVKPQKFAEVLPAYRSYARPGVLCLSVAAGITLAGMAELLGGEASIVRSMPNTPSAVGAGIAALIANRNAGEADRRLAQALLSAVGEAIWLEDEAQMHGVTALSGSGPAYVFHMVEAMAAAGEAQGLAPDMAMRLARQTVIGAGALMAANPAPASLLRENVTSPGGTTAAALNVLMGDDRLKRLMTEALTAAAKRSKELAG